MKKLVVMLLLPVVVLTGCASDGGSDGASDGAIEVSVEGDQVSGDTEVTVPTGTEVSIEVMSDATDTIHVHGYDLHEDVDEGSNAMVSFTADIPGVFEVELEEAGLLLVELTVE